MSKFFKVLPGESVTGSLCKLTNMHHEDAVFHLNNPLKARVTDVRGTLDIHAFRDIARSKGASDLGITNEVSRLTGSSFENAYLNLIKIRIDR